METKYGEFEDKVIIKEIKRLTNQIYKLLPSREEGLDWESPLQTIVEEFYGMSRVLIGQQDTLFPIICKMEGLFALTLETDFYAYRRTIFECLSLCNNLIKQCQV